MKNYLLTGMIAGLAALGAEAEVNVYVFEELGEVNGVADNGYFTVITDPDNGYAYLWSESEAEQLADISAVTGPDGNFESYENVKGTSAMDVSNDGTVVGAILWGGTYHPAYYKDGKWTLLPLDPNAKNSNEAICITPDGSVIAGYQFINDPEAETGGRFYPCQWFRNDDGTYSLKSYTNIELPDHQGFYPLTQSADGEIVAGTVYCGMQSRINAILKDGEMIIFEEIKTEYEPWMYKGKYYAGVDENGKQIWVEDVNDPRVVPFPEVYINGYKDGAAPLEGFFSNCDDEGNLYGCRSRVENVTEDGEGDVYLDAAIYNYKTDTWYTDSSYPFFSAGIGTELLYTGDGKMIDKGEVLSVANYYDIDADGMIQGINKISTDARVLGGVYSQFNPAIGENMYYPFVVVTNEPNGIQTVVGAPAKGLVVVTAGCIEVINAETVAVYDMEGRLVSTEMKSHVNPGIYVVKAGENSYKVMVK